MKPVESTVATCVRWVGLILFPALITVAGLLAHPSKRQAFVFLASFSFQSNLLGWVYLITKSPLIGQCSTRYLLFVIIVWMYALANLESSRAERVFNELLHYVHPLSVIAYWSTSRARVTGIRPWLIGLLFPAVYLVCMLLVNARIGYELYPVLSTNPGLVLSVLAVTEGITWKLVNL